MNNKPIPKEYLEAFSQTKLARSRKFISALRVRMLGTYGKHTAEHLNAPLTSQDGGAA